MLEVDIAEGSKGEKIRWKTAVEVIGSKAEGDEGVQSA